MKPKTLVQFFLFLALAPLAFGQIPDSQLVFAYAGVSYRAGSSLTSTEKDLLDARFRSYFLEIARQERYTLTSLRDGELVVQALMSSPDAFLSYQTLNRRLSAQGLLAMELSKVGGTWQFGAGIYDPATGELLHSNLMNYGTFNDLLEASRNQLYDLFGLQAPIIGASIQVSPLGSSSVGAAVSVTMADLVGTWKGDFDLGTIRIEGDGTAIAQLEGNETLRLRVSLERNRIIVRQDEPNAPKLYVGSFSLALAGQIARQARPMQWDFTLNGRKDQLVGIKQTTKVYIERGVIQQVDNSYFRDAVWTRMP